MAKREAPKAKAAACHDDGTLYILVARGRAMSTIAWRDGKPIDEQPAIAGASRIAVLPGGAVVTASSAGKVKLAAPEAKARSCHLDRHVTDLVVVGGAVYAPGAGRRLAKLDEATATWQPTGLREATLPHLPVVEGHQTDDVHAVCAGPRGPIIAMHADKYWRVLVMESDGTSWRLRAALEQRANAIAWSPDDDVVYTVGDAIHAITRDGMIEQRGSEGDRGLWSAAWLRGTLYAGGLSTVVRVAPATGAVATVLDDTGPVPHNQSLFASPSGEHAAFVAGGEVHAFDGKRFVALSLR